MPRRRKPVYRTFEASPYGCLVTVVIGATTRGLMRHLDALGCEDVDRDGIEIGNLDAITHPVEDGRVLMRFRGWPLPPGLIAHESFHAAVMILSRAGLTLTDESDEAYAYLIDAIVERVTDAAR